VLEARDYDRDRGLQRRTQNNIKLASPGDVA
jgi:hypothetical protein